MDFKTLFKNFKCETSDKMAHIYQLLKPLLIDRLVDFLLHNRHSPAGRPVKIDFDQLFDAFILSLKVGHKQNMFHTLEFQKQRIRDIWISYQIIRSLKVSILI